MTIGPLTPGHLYDCQNKRLTSAVVCNMLKVDILLGARPEISTKVSKKGARRWRLDKEQTDLRMARMAEMSSETRLGPRFAGYRPGRAGSWAGEKENEKGGERRERRRRKRRKKKKKKDEKEERWRDKLAATRAWSRDGAGGGT